eukprot:TRINITY_DN11815_c0_g1_i1.p1 TRINITY_DN11815_c0_g1~~TRINITY_DN11815_c0_g1_i1.p1  ORF type:complete len:606 (+),score=144.86 TRINITY_DN11815_c0_g1_i1:85-1902(+)
MADCLTLNLVEADSRPPRQRRVTASSSETIDQVKQRLPVGDGVSVNLSKGGASRVLPGHERLSALGIQSGDTLTVLISSNLAGSGLCGVWTSSVYESSGHNTTKQSERYRFKEDGVAEYSRHVCSFSAARTCDQNERDCDEFVLETARGTGTVTLLGDGTLSVLCSVEMSHTTGVGSRHLQSDKKRRTTASHSQHLLETTRGDFEEEFTKFVEIRGDLSFVKGVMRRPSKDAMVPQRSVSAGAAAERGPERSKGVGADVRQGSLQVYSAARRQSLEKTRDLARLSVRLGDYGKARHLLQDIGDREGAQRLLRMAFEDKARQFGLDHPEVAKIQEQLEQLGPPGPASGASAAAAPPLALQLPSQDVALSRRSEGAVAMPMALCPAEPAAVASKPAGANGASVQWPALPPLPPKKTSRNAAATAAALQTLGLGAAESSVEIWASKLKLGYTGGGGDALASGLLPSVGFSMKKLEKVREIFEEWVLADEKEGDALSKARRRSQGISKAAMTAALQRLRPNMGVEDIGRIFNSADGNKDGFLDFDEFSKWFVECRSLHEDVALAPRKRRLGDPVAVPSWPPSVKNSPRPSLATPAAQHRVAIAAAGGAV